ncbi:MAG TPA: polysaccharide biosynthesis protein [Candidatus Saccharimonadales bacterium]|nr:polysaccharide biosynthesis protein [Candidatus Saccharimonadales bacterium]
MARIEKSILIIGAGDAGQLLSRDIAKNYRSYQVIGFLDDNIKEAKLPILGKISDCQKVVNKYAVDEIVIAVPSADGKLIRTILLANLTNRLPIRIVPRSQRVISKSLVRYEEVKDIQPEDFLGRPFVRNNVDRLKRYYRDKTVFVTGGAGSIGSEIVRQLVDLEVKKVVVYDNSEYLIFMLEQQLKERGQRDRCDLIIGSILNDDKLDHLFKTIKPDIVFHAAAYKHVHLMQDNIDESVHNNVIGTKRAIDAAIKNNILLQTFISTDKVVNPTSVMGATKKLCEYYINSLDKAKVKFNVVRFGNVINSNGSVLPLFERQIILHRYVTITHRKMERFFMSIREAAQLVIESTATGETDSIHVLNMGELINIYEVALCLIRSKNLLPTQDVEVRVMGLRKGEKLIEELYTKTEQANLSQTKDSRILALKNRDIPERDINEIIADLGKKIESDRHNLSLRAALKEIFPTLKLGDE